MFCALFRQGSGAHDHQYAGFSADGKTNYPPGTPSDEGGTQPVQAGRSGTPTKYILTVTFVIESIGALLLALRFVPLFGWVKEYTTAYFIPFPHSVMRN